MYKTGCVDVMLWMPLPIVLLTEGPRRGKCRSVILIRLKCGGISVISHFLEGHEGRLFDTGVKLLGRGHGRLSCSIFVASRSLSSAGELSGAANAQWI